MSILIKFNESSPFLIKEELFGATFNKDGESLFLRMELLTEENSECWTKFQQMTSWIANANSRGVLSSLVRLAGKANYPVYNEKTNELTGFTNEEYVEFTQKAIELKERTTNKITDILANNSIGSNHMYTGSKSGHYIIYASKKYDFNIQEANNQMINACNLKNYITAYSDILIAVGSDFSKEDSFYNRGIFRNPYWVFEEKYSGLSMILHGFSGAVAEKYFPEKMTMSVTPVGSMQYIINKNLLPGEGYTNYNGQEIDLTTLEVSSDAPEYSTNYIKISALTRIYNKIIKMLS